MDVSDASVVPTPGLPVDPSIDLAGEPASGALTRRGYVMKVNRPGVWAFHCHILPHVEAASGTFGMVNTLIVVPHKAHVDAIVNALVS